MEKYRLSWTPSVSSNAGAQSLEIAANGVLPSTPLGKDASSFDMDFPSDANVEWFVSTTSIDGLQKVDSEHATFVATDQTSILPATGFRATFISHS